MVSMAPFIQKIVVLFDIWSNKNKRPTFVAEIPIRKYDYHFYIILSWMKMRLYVFLNISLFMIAINYMFIKIVLENSMNMHQLFNLTK